MKTTDTAIVGHRIVSAEEWGCSLEVDHLEGILGHLQNHDVTYAAVARAPIEEIELEWQSHFLAENDNNRSPRDRRDCLSYPGDEAENLTSCRSECEFRKPPTFPSVRLNPRAY